MKKVSVIITTYGNPEKLQRAIDSVLQQTYNCYEILVVDDNNPKSEFREETERKMNKYVGDDRIKYIKHERNLNGAAARNTGLKYASGEFISFLDNDDFFLEHRLQKCVKCLEKQPFSGGVLSYIYILDERGKRVHTINDNLLNYNDLIIDSNLLGSGSNIFLRKDIIDKVGKFDEAFWRYQDVEYMVRVLENCSISLIKDKTLVKDNLDKRKTSYTKLKNAFYQFENKFNKEISQLNNIQYNIYLENRFSGLRRAAIFENDRTKIKDVKQLIKTYRKLTIKDFMFLHFPTLYKFFYKIIVN